MIRIEPLERFSIDGMMYYPGEIRLVSEAVAKTACGAGWAKDLDGNIPTAERDPTARKLQIKPMGQEHGATTPAS